MIVLKTSNTITQADLKDLGPATTPCMYLMTGDCLTRFCKRGHFPVNCFNCPDYDTRISSV